MVFRAPCLPPEAQTRCSLYLFWPWYVGLEGSLDAKVAKRRRLTAGFLLDFLVLRRSDLSQGQ